MKYIECRSQHCDFLVTPQDEYCPNCGAPKLQLHMTEDYLKSVAFNPFNHKWFFAVTYMMVFLLVNAILLIVADNLGDDTINVAALIFIASLITGILVFGGFFFLEDFYVKSLRLDVQHNPNLKQIERAIRQRLNEIKEQEAQIEIVLSRVKQHTGEQWDIVCRRLMGAKVMLQQQHTRYSAKLLEIGIVRWQNRIVPLVKDLDDLSFAQTDSRLQDINAKREQGMEIKANLESQQRAFGTVPETQQLSERLDETLLSCQMIQEALVRRQAVMALKHVTPLKDAMLPTSTPFAALKGGEVLNSQVAVTDFSSAFEELEAEYTRMQSEEDLGQQVKRILQRAEDTI
jgi:hypothetical protein